MRGNRSELAPARKSPRCHVNTPLELRLDTYKNHDTQVKLLIICFVTLYIEKVLLLLFLLINSPMISFREGPLFFEDKGWAISPPPPLPSKKNISAQQ